MTVRVIVADVRAGLARLADESVHCVVTSPPYYGLRDYGIEPQVWGGEPGCCHQFCIEVRPRIVLSNAHTTLQGGQSTQASAALPSSEHGFCGHCNAWRGSLGLEPTPALYIEHMVAVFREVKRVLRADGTLWLNIGDSYAGSDMTGGTNSKDGSKSRIDRMVHGNRRDTIPGMKQKDLIGIPWMLAFALRDDGWYLRSEITWAKKAPMPESVTDRPTSATEKVFLLSRSPRYFYDAEAVKEEGAGRLDLGTMKFGGRIGGDTGWHNDGGHKEIAGRNMRNWWLLGPEPFPEAHFATFPTEIPRRAILAGTSEKGVCPKCGAGWVRVVNKRLVADGNRKTYAGVKAAASDGMDHGSNCYRDGHLPGNNAVETIGWRQTCSCNAGDPVPATVLDPFLGAGTTALVADRLNRHCIGIELNAEYARMAERRIKGDAPLFAEITTEGDLPPDWQEQDALGSWRVAVDAMRDKLK